MKIIVDAMGGDNAPLEIIKGVRLAVDEYKAEAILVGDKSVIEICASDIFTFLIKHSDGQCSYVILNK